MSVDRRPSQRLLLELEVADAREQLAGGGHDLGADPVARERDDVRWHGAERYPGRRASMFRRT